jgi:hypothetical protein
MYVYTCKCMYVYMYIRLLAREEERESVLTDALSEEVYSHLCIHL